MSPAGSDKAAPSEADFGIRPARVSVAAALDSVAAKEGLADSNDLCNVALILIEEHWLTHCWQWAALINDNSRWGFTGGFVANVLYLGHALSQRASSRWSAARGPEGVFGAA